MKATVLPLRGRKSRTEHGGMNVADILTEDLTVRLHVGTRRIFGIDVRLIYRPGDPYVVQFVFSPLHTRSGQQAVWCVSRDGLFDGMGEGMGLGFGDIQIWPYTARTTRMALIGADGEAIIDIRTAELRAFLERSSAMVPIGAEHLQYDLERELAALLGGL